jgi:hypothetical protein
MSGSKQTKKHMIASQLERLKQDYTDLDYYIQRLQKEGNTLSITGMQKKQQFIKEVIESLQSEEIMQAA